MNVICKDYSGELSYIKRTFRSNDNRILDLFDLEIYDAENDTLVTLKNVALEEIIFTGIELSISGAVSN